MRKKQTTEEFIYKANITHGNKYNYSLSKQNGLNKKITIICPIHGNFEQISGNHLNGQGCKKCFIENKKFNNDIFINKANSVHNNFYNYSKLKYKTIKDKITIICPIHGDFEQIGQNHLQGKGCSNCNGGGKKTIIEFIEKANIKHNNFYNYSIVEYINDKIKIDIICPLHGNFKQQPNSHLNGKGCPICGNIKKNKNKFLTINEFINKANIKHCNKYDYTLTKYYNVNEKIDIICPLHGIFKQKPSNHIYQGNGCPKCRESKGEREIREFLEINTIKYIPQHKFKECKNINPLPFDFYLLDYNLCIEYDGEQHFKILDYFGGVKKYEALKKRDEIKTKYCLLNNIKLLRIKYNEDISSILFKNLI